MHVFSYTVNTQLFKSFGPLDFFMFLKDTTINKTLC